MAHGNALGRGLVAVVALLVAAWLLAGLRSAVLEDRGRDLLTEGISFGDPTTAQRRTLSRAARDLDRAGWLNPDRVPRMYYAQTLVVLGEEERGRRIALEVARKEPDNLEVWQTARAIGLATADRRLQALAGRRIRALNPR